MTTQAAPRNQELRETASGLEMYDETTQTWWPVELWGNIDDAILERLYSSQDVAGRTFNEVLGGSTEGDGQAATGGKPPWWDALVAATGGNLPAFEDIGIEKDDNDNSVYNIVKANQVLKAANDMAKSLGLVQEEQEQEGLTPEQEQAILAEFPNKVVDIDKNGNRTFIDKPVVEESAAPRTFPKPADAHAFARESGLNDGDYNLTWAVNGWQITVDPIKGQRHTSFASAERAKPPGFNVVPITLNDGSQVWGYEVAEPEPAQRIDNFDDLIIQTYMREGSAAALRIDAFRDRVNAPNVTMMDAIEFAMAAGAKTAQEFKDFTALIMSASQQQTFAQDIQAASFEFGAAQAGLPQPGGSRQTDALKAMDPFAGQASEFSTPGFGGINPLGPTADETAGAANISARSAFDQAERQAMNEGASPEEARRTAGQAFDEALKAANAQFEAEAEDRKERVLDPFSNVRFGTEERDGVTQTTVKRFGAPSETGPDPFTATIVRNEARGTGIFNNLGASEAAALQGNTPEQIAGRKRRAERAAQPVAAAPASRDFAAEIGASVEELARKRHAERPRRARVTRFG